MSTTEKEKKDRDPQAPAQVVAGVDIGSNAIRLVVAEVLPDGSIEVLENLQKGIRLGQDAFRRGRLSGPTMRAAVGILREFRRILDTYRPVHLRAVATSAVREAGNSDVFLDRILMATGLEVEVLDTAEESRLTVAGVRRHLSPDLRSKRGLLLVAHVGGGSTLLTVLSQGEIVESQSLSMGSIRMREGLLSGSEPPHRAAEMLRQQISNVLSATQSGVPLDRIETFIAIGGDARFVARRIGKPVGSEGLFVVPRGPFEKLVRQCERQTAEEQARTFGLEFPDAETLNPALMVYRALLDSTQAGELYVSQVSMRNGLLLDLASRVTGKEDEALAKGIVRSAQAVARKYRVDRRHAQSVGDLALRLFDELLPEHGMSPRHRLLLRVAALLHEVGGFVSNRSHHKHSYYLIANAEVFGLSREEHVLVAHVARYHRRAAPQPTHLEYMALPRDKRILVSKLAALLRVADALDRAHTAQVRDFRCERLDDELVLNIPGVSDLTLERQAVAQKSDLFTDIFGLKVRVEEARTPLVPGAM
ncbi:MAG: Ppx/GppA family phosphatase [Zetaproteobacteria bacterium]|nr:MAG: Ppx/GppA family phosphatase [Zetaproteobacteria bacterium]